MDMIDTYCPCCNYHILDADKEENIRDVKRFYRFEHYLQVSFYKQIIFFLVGLLGMYILGFALSFIFQAVGISVYGIQTREELIEFLKRADIQFWINVIAYVALFIAMSLILWKKGWKEIVRSFKKPIAIGIGFAGFGACFVCNFIYGILTSVIFQMVGWETTVNANEATLRAMYDVNLPLFIVVIGFIGPFVEEMTYRCGLFSFFGRIKRWLAYLISALVFGLIHFTWDFSSAQAFVTELVNLPSYVGAGLIMAFVYEKGGFAASYTMHAANNVYSIVANLILRNFVNE